MPSKSLGKWSTERRADLDHIEDTFRSIEGLGDGPAWQIAQSYAVLLAAQFQGFCRDLHSECIEFFIPPGLSLDWSTLLGDSLGWRRRLDTGNPGLGTIAEDFGRFGLELSEAVRAGIPRSEILLEGLRKLLDRRNAIAHNDFSRLAPGLEVEEVRGWRESCDGLAVGLDALMAEQIRFVTGASPW